MSDRKREYCYEIEYVREKDIPDLEADRDYWEVLVPSYICCMKAPSLEEAKQRLVAMEPPENLPIYFLPSTRVSKASYDPTKPKRREKYPLGNENRNLLRRQRGGSSKYTEAITTPANSQSLQNIHGGVTLEEPPIPATSGIYPPPYASIHWGHETDTFEMTLPRDKETQSYFDTTTKKEEDNTGVKDYSSSPPEYNQGAVVIFSFILAAFLYAILAGACFFLFHLMGWLHS